MLKVTQLFRGRIWLPGHVCGSPLSREAPFCSAILQPLAPANGDLRGWSDINSGAQIFPVRLGKRARPHVGTQGEEMLSAVRVHGQTESRPY